MNADARRVAVTAMRSAEAVTASLDMIDRSRLAPGVWDVLYGQAEAIGQLATAVLFLADA